jgi:hypothetical protein
MVRAIVASLQHKVDAIAENVDRLTARARPKKNSHIAGAKLYFAESFHQGKYEWQSILRLAYKMMLVL